MKSLEDIIEGNMGSRIFCVRFSRPDSIKNIAVLETRQKNVYILYQNKHFKLYLCYVKIYIITCNFLHDLHIKCTINSFGTTKYDAELQSLCRSGAEKMFGGTVSKHVIFKFFF